jgi:hypothetical protein
LAYNLSLRNLEEMMAERGVSVDHATIHRWTPTKPYALLHPVTLTVLTSTKPSLPLIQ